jgi:hypothetical protein
MRKEPLPRVPFAEVDFEYAGLDGLDALKEKLKTPGDVVLKAPDGISWTMINVTGRVVDDGPPARVRWEGDTFGDHCR